MKITEKEIYLYLVCKGIPQANKGFAYLMTAIQRAAEGHTSTGMIYRYVAEKHNTTHSRVERAIRHAIESAGGKIKNSEFIARAANELKYGGDYNG